MKVLVTGGNGFIGSFLTQALLTRGDSVRCLVRQSSNLQWLKNLEVEYVYGELSDPSSLIRAADGCKMIFHLAGVTKARDEAGYMQANYQGTLNLLNAAKTVGDIKKFVFISSQAAGGPTVSGLPRTEADEPAPVSMYGRSKLRAEWVVMDHANIFPVTIIRPPSVYGPRDVDVFEMYKNINKGILPVLGKGTGKASLVHVDDLIQGILLAADNPDAQGRIFYISGDGEYNWLQIGNMIASALDKKPLALHVPPFMLDVVSWSSMLLSKLNGKPALLNKDKVREMKQPSWLCSSQRARQELGFTPHVNAATGFKSTADWYVRQGWL